MSYKALILDIDGTIASFDGNTTQVSPKVIDALNLAAAKLHVGVATGRSWEEARQILKGIDLKGPSIFASGAYIRDFQTGEILVANLLTDSQVHMAMEIAEGLGLDFHVYDNGVDVSAKDGFEKPETGFFIAVDSQTVEILKEKLNEIDNTITHTTISLTPERFDLHLAHKLASKDIAIVQLREILGIKKEEIIAVGDGPNDIALFKEVGFKVALEHGDENLKKFADFIAPSISNDGVAYVIEKFI